MNIPTHIYISSSLHPSPKLYAAPLQAYGRRVQPGAYMWLKKLTWAENTLFEHLQRSRTTFGKTHF